MRLVLVALAACGPKDTDSAVADTDTDTDADTDADTDTDTDTDTDADTDADTDTDTDTDTDADPGWYRVDSGGSAVERSADLAVAPDGTVYVVWVEGDDAWVRRSADGGATWDAAAKVDDGTVVPGVSMARRPYVATDGDRVAVAFNDFDTKQVYVYTSDADALAFTQVAVLTGGSGYFNDFPKPVFSGGDLVVGWQPFTPDGWIAIARESTGWKLEQLDGDAPGVPCECCPNDLVLSSAGDLLAIYRNNDGNVREHWISVLDGAGAEVSGAWEVSDTEGTLWACPMEGPRVGENADGDLLAVWSDASGSGVTWIASSGDRGRTWSAESDVMGMTGTSGPTIALGSDGTVWVSTESGNRSALSSSTDGGASFADLTEMVSPSGAFGYAQLDANGGVVGAAGTAGDGTVWLYRIE